MPLTSPQNPLLQKVRRAVASGRPMEDGAMAAEGPHLLAEALSSPWRVEHIFCSPNALSRHQHVLQAASHRRIEVTEVADRAFQSLSSTEHSQGVIALLRPRLFSWPELLEAPGPIVILDGIQDPGNAGTIMRSTEAFGGGGIIFSEGCVRISNGKVMRAAAGSLFRLPFLENISRHEMIQHLTEARRTIFALTTNGQTLLTETSFTSPFAMVVGSEGNGVSAPFINVARTLSIKTRGVESLNAAVACSIALFEASRSSR